LGRSSHTRQRADHIMEWWSWWIIMVNGRVEKLFSWRLEFVILLERGEETIWRSEIRNCE
jgi:hypothetical protein